MEIGSEFWDVPVQHMATSQSPFPFNTQWYLSGRSALKAIINNLTNVKTVAMPSWCCDSMIKPFVDAGVEVHFYPVYLSNEGKFNQKIRYDCDVLYLMDYFGYTVPDNTGKTHNNLIVIRDVTHSIFSSQYKDADYYYGSLRKWCGIWTGGYAWTSDGHKLFQGDPDKSDYTLLRDKAMKLKNAYINEYIVLNGNQKFNKEEFLGLFSEAEDELENIKVSPAADRDVELARFLDIDYIKARRRKNAEILMKSFCDWLIFPFMNEFECPMFVPVIVPDGRRNELRNFLIHHQIYCPVHWPLSHYHKDLTNEELFIYENELSLVCDQRYTEEDMKRIVDTINAYWEGK